MNKIRIIILTLIYIAFTGLSYGCTIFTSSSENAVFAGNNEDMCTTNTEIHLIPAKDGKYGRIFWGFIGDENYQGGMNEYGLFFDGAGTPSIKMPSNKLPVFEGRYIMETVLEQCKTVEEAIAFLKKYSHPSLQYSHNLIADSKGDAVIIEWGNGKLNFIRKCDDNYLIATNFNITESENINSECQRYNIARDILSYEEPSLKTFEKILSLTHQEGKFGTVYSNICDLKNKKVFLYNFHNFTIKKELDLIEELKKGEKKYRIRDLFPVNFSEMFFRMRLDCIGDFDNVATKNIGFVIKSKTKIPECNIAIRGSSAELGKWNKEGVSMVKVTDYTYSKFLKIKEGTLFDFELSIGNNQYKALDNELNKLKEITLEVNSDTTLILNVSEWKLNR
ncbi:MAG: linear amide C-N hydrolase [bacterium]|nr:linear amide C-N hydrolase [bacterium]